MKKKDLHIVPECFIDTNLAEYLLNSQGVNHQKSCNNVAKTMMESKLKNQFSVGIIDNDKRQHSYLNEFVEIARTKHISLLKHSNRPHYFVRISPAMDLFILDCATELDVNPQNYGLPFVFEKFTKETKKVNAKKDHRFKQLFKAIESSREMSILNSVLNYLNSQQYQSQTEELQKLFDESNYDGQKEEQ